MLALENVKTNVAKYFQSKNYQVQEKGKSIKGVRMCNKSERVPSVLILISNILALQVNRRLVILMKFILWLNRSGVKNKNSDWFPERPEFRNKDR